MNEKKNQLHFESYSKNLIKAKNFLRKLNEHLHLYFAAAKSFFFACSIKWILEWLNEMFVSCRYACCSFYKMTNYSQQSTNLMWYSFVVASHIEETEILRGFLWKQFNFNFSSIFFVCMFATALAKHRQTCNVHLTQFPMWFRRQSQFRISVLSLQWFQIEFHFSTSIWLNLRIRLDIESHNSCKWCEAFKCEIIMKICSTRCFFGWTMCNEQIEFNWNEFIANGQTATAKHFIVKSVCIKLLFIQ